MVVEAYPPVKRKVFRRVATTVGAYDGAEAEPKYVWSPSPFAGHAALGKLPVLYVPIVLVLLQS